MEHVKNTAQLIAILILFAATAATLVAIADTGRDQILQMIKNLINV